MDEEEDGGSNASHDQLQPKTAPTLLPASIASVVSLVTRSSALYLRLGTLIGGLAIDGARVTTLTSLEISRAVIEGILAKAGRDVSLRSTGELGRADAESLLEKSIATLHSTISHISFAASAGFHLSAASLSSASDISQHLLAALDSILGSTDSSRAIASIITLVRREFENPATGQPGEKVGVVDLLTGICGLVLLQRWCQKLTDQESREKHYEEVIWDVVILDDGRRADVVGSSEPQDGASTDVVRQDATSSGNKTPVTFITASGEDRIVEAVERRGQEDDGDDDGPENGLKERIMQTLPPDASVSITTEVTTTKTITVEITGATPPDLSPPPGVEIVEENSHHTGEIDLNGAVLTNEQKLALLIPRYRVVYRIIRNKMRGTTVAAGSDPHESDLVNDREMVDVSTPPTTVSDVQSATAVFSDIEIEPTPSKKTFSLSPLSSPDPEELPYSENHSAGKNEPPLRNDTDRTLAGAVEVLQSSPGNSASQKRSRNALSTSSSLSGSENPTARRISGSKTSLLKKGKPELPPRKGPEKKATLRNVLRKGSGAALSNMWSREQSPPETKSSIPRPAWGAHRPAQTKTGSASLQVPQRISSIVPARDAPRAPQRGNPNHFSSRDLGRTGQEELPRSPSRTSYYSVHQTRRDSIVSQTDTYSLHSTDTRPASPSTFRTHVRTQSTLLRARSEKDVGLVAPQSPSKNHKRTRSHVPSIYTVNTNNSETSLILASRPRKSAFADIESLRSFARTGHVDGLFPQHHLVHNITRFIRFASASYGSHFLRIMGITSSASTSVTAPLSITAAHHHEHNSFSSHTRLPPSTILLSSFADPQPSPSPTAASPIFPLVHFITLDHASCAVVLTCRGTLGFEDVLTDLTFDYDTLTLRGRPYKVHKGIYASALRLLSPAGSRVLATLAAALEEFPSYGLVLCGHSLGGAVAAVLAILLSEPSPGTAFITANTLQYLPPASLDSSNPPIRLPPSRPIHVYAYGPPSTLSPSLRLATRGLITTVVNNQDLVPYLSLGTLHDLQAVSLAFQNDSSGAKGEVRARVWAMLAQGLADKWYAGREARAGGEDDEWALSALKALRASMLSPKLVPPGEVFIVESLRVLKRDVGSSDGAGLGGLSAGVGGGLGRPAVRAVLKYVRDVEARFGELRFGGSMLLDHSPGRYEASLGALGRGVLE